MGEKTTKYSLMGFGHFLLLMKVNIIAGRMGIGFYKAKGGKEERQRTYTLQREATFEQSLAYGSTLSFNNFKNLYMNSS